MKEYTISAFTENKTGILTRVVGTFTRRNINIESLTASESSIKDIFRILIVVKVPEEVIIKLVAQIDKQVDIIKAFYYENDEIVYQELALYKIPTSAFSKGLKLEQLVRDHNIRILTIETEYTVFEKTGHKHETRALLVALEQYGIYEYITSGRVAITKPMEQLNSYLKSLEAKISETP